MYAYNPKWKQVLIVQLLFCALNLADLIFAINYTFWLELEIRYPTFLNQARAGRRPARDWFLEIAFVRDVCVRACVRACVCACVRACVCVCPCPQGY